MGTKVQWTIPLPGLYTMRNPNEDAAGCQSQYHKEKTPDGNLCNSFQLMQANGCLEYNKEMIKRTILEHEAVFRKQIYELHRIYKVQKDMMDELKKRTCRRQQIDTSQSYSFSSQIPSEGTNRSFKMDQIEATTINKPASLVVTDDKNPIMNFFNENSVQSDHKELPRRGFDLQLPADMYIDCVKGSPEKKIVVKSPSVTTALDVVQSADYRNNVNFTLGMTKAPNSSEESWKPDLHRESCPTTWSFLDLNETAGEICIGKGDNSVSAKFLSPGTPLVENKGLQLPMRSVTGMPSPSARGHCSEGTSPNYLYIDDEDNPGRAFFNYEAGQSSSSMKIFSSDSTTEKLAMTSERMHMNQGCNEFLSLDQNKRERSLQPKVEISGRSNQNGQTCSPLPQSLSDAYLNYTRASSPLASSWATPANACTRLPLEVPSRPCFNGAAAKGLVNLSDKSHYCGDLRSQIRVGMDPNLSQNGFNHGLGSDHSSASQLHFPAISFGKPNLGGDTDILGCGRQKSEKDVHFNQALQNKFQNGRTTQRTNELEWDTEDSSRALSWNRKKPTCDAFFPMVLDLSQGYPRLKSSCSAMDSRCEERQKSQKEVKQFNLLELPSSSEPKEAINMASDSQHNKKIFGFSIPETTQCGDAFSPQQEQFQSATSDKNEIDDKDVKNKAFHGPDGVQLIKISIAGLKNHIDLNFDLNAASDLSDEGDKVLEVPLQVSAPTVPSEIDLEAPVMLVEGQQDEAAIREAAENILRIASDHSYGLDLNPIPSNSLDWFAEVVSSHADRAEESSDTFEQLTLELEEIKPEDYWCRSSEEVKDDDDGDGNNINASMFFTKPRKGQGRKRRQKRDFQRDILPGLVSLSRHEVTEDIQTIGALMKASGQSWQSGGTPRRNGKRNGTNCRGRVGRKPRSLAATAEVIQLSPPPPPPPPPPPRPADYSEVEIDKRNIIGWGRTTRRCRRQRLPLVTNVAAPLT